MDSRVFLGHSTSLAFKFTSLATLVRACTYPAFELSDAVLLLAKLLPEIEGWGRIWKSVTSGQASNYPDVRWCLRTDDILYDDRYAIPCISSN